MLKHRWQCILFPILGTALVALAATYFTDTASLWYQSLTKPAIQPPPVVFTAAWVLIYCLLALSAAIVCISEKQPPVRNALYMYGINGALNAFWTYLFFQKHLLVSALVCLALLLLSTALLIRYVRKIENIAALLLFPYLLWLTFALALNYAIAMIN